MFHRQFESEEYLKCRQAVKLPSDRFVMMIRSIDLSPCANRGHTDNIRIVYVMITSSLRHTLLVGVTRAIRP